MRRSLAAGRAPDHQCKPHFSVSPTLFLTSEIVPDTISHMGIVAEFAKYNARLRNQFWAVSALTDTEMVASLWEHRIHVENGRWVYRDHLSRWSGNGNALFREHLMLAIAEARPVRIVKATTNNVAHVEEGGDASKAKNTFKARPEWIGQVASFDGDNFEIVFEQSGKVPRD